MQLRRGAARSQRRHSRSLPLRRFRPQLRRMRAWQVSVCRCVARRGSLRAMSRGGIVGNYYLSYKEINSLTSAADAINLRASTIGSEAFNRALGARRWDGTACLAADWREPGFRPGTLDGATTTSSRFAGPLAAEPLPWNALRSHAIADGLHPGAGGSLWNQPAVNVVFPPALPFLLRPVVLPPSGRRELKERCIHAWRLPTIEVPRQRGVANPALIGLVNGLAERCVTGSRSRSTHSRGFPWSSC